MRHAADFHRLHQRRDRLEIALVDGQQHLGHSPRGAGENILGLQLGGLEDHLARQRIAVGVEPRRRQADQDIAGLDALAGDDFPPAHHAHNGADQVILFGRIQARHLGRLAPKQGTAVLAARLADPAHHLLENPAFELGNAHVVHEEQRNRALDKDVVHAMVHDVLSDGGMVPGHGGDFQLGADAVGAGHEDLVLAWGGEESAEGADIVEDPGRLGGLHHLLDGGDPLHLLVNVHTRRRIRRRHFLCRILAHIRLLIS